MNFQIERYGTVASTNDILREKARAGAPAGIVAVAERQTAGRGRMGRSFLSEEGGLYMSLLLRPSGSAADAMRITAQAAIAVALAIEKHTGEAAAIKWVNDIYQGGKKVCGILAEGQIGVDGMDFIILGIGIIFLRDSYLRDTMWDISTNPYRLPDNIHPVIWEATVFKNRLFLGIGCIVWMMLGLLNLQKREKFI